MWVTMKKILVPPVMTSVDINEQLKHVNKGLEEVAGKLKRLDDLRR